jgi:hypothetical protein
MRVRKLNLDHLRTLTDTTGAIQHAIFSIPNRRTGYTTDDNARALALAARIFNVFGDRESLRLACCYLSFVLYAQRPDGRFRNFLSYDQAWLDDLSSDDCFGRALGSFGTTVSSPELPQNMRRSAWHMLLKSRRWLAQIHSPRAQAFAIVGLAACCEKPFEASRDMAAEVRTLADRLEALFRSQSTPDWPWFEPVLTYNNAYMPLALLCAHRILGEARYLDVGLESLDFLIRGLVENSVFSPPGTDGWWEKGGKKTAFDQQPVEAEGFIRACLEAFRVTGRPHYAEMARLAFDWFFGANVLGLQLFDPAIGGCCDGLMPEGVNANQGTESTVSALSSELCFVELGLDPGPLAAAALTSTQRADSGREAQ